MEENKLATSNHFFKVLIPGFHKKLNLPPFFCMKLKQEKPEWAMLKSRKGRSKIKVCRNCEGLISLEAGWPQFVNHHSLSVGDFLVFEHVGRLNFNVFVFDPSACEKHFLIEPKIENENADNHEAVIPSRPKKSKREGENESTFTSHDTRNPHFIKTITPYNEKAEDVTIPVRFVRLNTLGKKTIAILRDGRGRSWPVTLMVRRRQIFRISLHRGWSDFYISNELKVGDVCVFYLNPPGSSKSKEDIVFDVKICPSN